MAAQSPEQQGSASAIAILGDVYRNRDAAMRARAAGGARIIGYSCETVPVELICASGCLPYRLSGDPNIGPRMQELYVYPLMAKSMSASRARTPDFVVSICSQALEGRYSFADRLVISNTRKSFLVMQAQLRDAQDAFPEIRIPPVYVLDRAQTPFTSSKIFNRERVFVFREALAKWTGAPASDDALKTAIAQMNEVRALLRRAKALRSADTPRLSGAEALWFYGASRFLPPDEFLLLGTRALDEVEARPGRTGIRIFVSGSPIDQDELYLALEADGATVVADNHSWGDGLAEQDVDTQRAPLAALIDHYETMAPLIYPLSASVAQTVEIAREARADVAVLNVYEGDEIKLWEAPDERAALTEAGIPCLYLQEQPYRVADAEALRAQAAAFLLEGQA